LTYFGDNLYNHEKIESIVNLIELVKRSKSARLILTSREYIIAQALINHERFSNSDFLDAKYQLQLSEYNQLDKARILYNHLYFSDLDNSYVREIVVSKTYKIIVSHANYMPRIISSLTQSSRLKNVTESEYPNLFLEVLKNPKELWAHPFKQITSSARSVLLILLSLGSKAHSLCLEKASNSFLDLSAVKNNFSRSYDDYYQAINELFGSFLEPTGNRVGFHNPSLKDFLEDYLLQRPVFVMHIIESSVYLQQIFEIWKLTKKPDAGKNEYSTSIIVDSIASEKLISSREQQDKSISAFFAEIEFLLDVELESDDARLRSYILKELKLACKNSHSYWIDDFIRMARLVKLNDQVLNRPFLEEVLVEINKVLDEYIKNGDYFINLEELSSLSELTEDDTFPSIDVESCRSVFEEGIKADFFRDEINQIGHELDLEDVKEQIKNLERLTGVNADNLLSWIDEKIEEKNEKDNYPDAWDLYKASREEREEDEEIEVSGEDVETTISHMFNDLIDR
jgi:hypothetical protein